MKLKQVYNRHFLTFEFLISLAISILVFALAYKQLGFTIVNQWLNSNIERVSNLVALVDATMFGFVIVATSIIFALLDSERLRIVRQTALSDQIYRVYFDTIGWLSIAVVSSLLAYAFGSSNTIVFSGLSISVILSYLMLLSNIVSVMRLWRCVWIIQNIAKIARIPEPRIQQSIHA